MKRTETVEPRSTDSEYLGSKAFVRHLKRYVQAPLRRFAATVPPELRRLCRDELAAAGIVDSEITEAGVEFHGYLDSCYLANLWSRTAGRVLCRMEPFRAGAAEELFHKVSEIRWELWLDPSTPIGADAHVERSRIGHEGKVAETFLAAVRKRFRALGPAAPPIWGAQTGETEPDDSEESAMRQRVLVRLIDNRCEISLDTTGPRLHLRGYRLRHSGAPLRETLAGAILMKMGLREDIPVVDGMCGSGTIAVEAALVARRLPPGLRRSFLFESWPSFQKKTWEHLLRKARENSLPRAPSPIVAVDIDPDALSIAKENAERAGVSADIAWEMKDFFAFRPRDRRLGPGLIVLNPPYGGMRLGGGGKALYERLGAHLKESFAGWRAAILAPDRSTASALNLGSSRLWTIVHGGTPVLVVMTRL